jgi:hypothetical protein
MACGFVARDDGANGRRHHSVNSAKRRRRFLRQGSAKALGAGGVHEDRVLLKENRRVEAGGKHEMPLKQSAGGAKFVEDLILIHDADLAPAGAREN